jgi:hypothetical protein
MDRYHVLRHVALHCCFAYSLSAPRADDLVSFIESYVSEIAHTFIAVDRPSAVCLVNSPGLIVTDLFKVSATSHLSYWNRSLPRRNLAHTCRYM